MRTREIVTLILGLAAVAALVIVVKTRQPNRSDATTQEMTSTGGSEGKASRYPAHTGTPKLIKNGPAKTNRTLAQYTRKAGLNIMRDEDLPLSASGLIDDAAFHAYADVSPGDEDSLWIPIAVDYYDLKTGTVGIRSTGNEIREPERGTFLLTRVPR
jgi:hypothetical protein